MDVLIGVVILGGWIAGWVAYVRWLRRGVRPRVFTTVLSAEQVRDIFVGRVCRSGWHVVDDGNPLIAQSSLATGIRQQLGLTVSAAEEGRLGVRLETLRLAVRGWGRVPTKAHTLRLRMDSFVAAVRAADRSIDGATLGGPSAVGAGLPLARGHVPDGWYPDPLAEGRLRRWDGVAWTQETQLGSGPPMVAGPVPSVSTWAAPVSAPLAVPAVAPRDDLGDGWVAAEASPTPRRSSAPSTPAASGWPLLVVLAGVVLAGCFAPLFSIAGNSTKSLLQPADGVAVFALAGVLLAAAAVSASGYDVGLSLGGGAALGFGVVLAAAAPQLHPLFQHLGVSAHVGAVCLFAGGAVGVVVVVIALVAEGRTQHGTVPSWVALVALAGTACYVIAVLKPAYPGAKVFTGNWDIDAVTVALLAAVALPTVAFLSYRTATSAAFLAGGATLPAAGFAVELVRGYSIGAAGASSYVLTGVGFIAILAAAAIGMCGFARRAQAQAHGVRYEPVDGTTLGLGLAAVVLVGGIALLGHHAAQVHDLQRRIQAIDEPVDVPTTEPPSYVTTTTTDPYDATSSTLPSGNLVVGDYCVANNVATPLNLRTDASSSASVATSIPAGTCGVQDAFAGGTTTYADGHSWREVTWDGWTGWVADEFLTPGQGTD